MNAFRLKYRSNCWTLFALNSWLVVGIGNPTTYGQDTHDWTDLAGGIYGTFNNWSPLGVPSPFDTARFDLATAEPIQVSFIQDRNAAALEIVDGEFAFSGSGIAPGGRTYNVDDATVETDGHLALQQSEPPGVVRDLELVVDNLLDIRGEMSVREGTLVTSTLANVDSLDGAKVFVNGANAAGGPSRWEAESLNVGVDEQGSVQVSSGGQLATSFATIAQNISSDALIFDAAVNVQGVGSDGSRSTWTNLGRLNVGDGGRARISVEAGAFASSDTVVIRSSSSVDVLGVDAVGNPSHFNSGTGLLAMGGRLEIVDGALATSEEVSLTHFGTVDVRGTDDAGNPSTWNISGELVLGGTDRGSIFIESGGLVTSDTTKIGTDFSNQNDSLIFLGGGFGPEISTWNNSGDVFVGGSQTEVGGPAKFVVNDGTRADIGGTVKIWGPGTVDMSGGELTADVIDHIEGGQFSFLGGTMQVNQFNGDLVNQGGTLSPGSSAGATTITGDYTQQPDAKLTLEIGGTGAGSTHDLVGVGGSTALDGLLELALINSFTPDSSDEFFVLVASNIIGVFDNVATGQRLSTTDGRGSFVVNYGLGSAFDASQIVLSDFEPSAGIPGDFDIDGDVDGFDFLKWQRGESPNPLSPADLTAWNSNFGATPSPLMANTSAVPEPSSFLLLLPLLVLTNCRCRQRRNTVRR